MKPQDISEILDGPDEMPLCPICQSIISEYDTGTLVSAFGIVGLAHADCLDDDED
jgi:hypothetical protein